MKNRRLLSFFLVIALSALGACRKQPAQRQQNANSNAIPSAQDSPASGVATNGEKFYFRGTIAGNLRIEMTLLRDGERLTGTYFYPKAGKNIALTATIDKDRNVSFGQSAYTDNQTA